MLRFVDTEMNPLHFLSMKDFLEQQLPSLQQALEPVIHRIDHLDQFIQIAKTKCHFPSEHDLTPDESAAIFLYTMEWNDSSLYQTIQKDLHSTDRSTSQSWLLYLKLFDIAVQKLPSARMNVWRGMDEDICQNLNQDDEFIWWTLTSCSSSDNVIKGCLKLNSRLCSIEIVNGKDISIYSNFQNQKEVILCPGIRLQVVSSVRNQTSSSVLYLQECHRRMSSPAITKSGAVKVISSRWYNNRVFSLVPHFIVLIVALLFVTTAGKSLSTFRTSYITTVLTTSSYRSMQVIFPSRSEFDLTTMIDAPSTIHIYVDTFGNRYEGEWLDGKKHGKGKMDFANGYKYTGDWVDDMATGEGIFIWTNGEQYEGQVKDGQRHGKGSYYFANGDKYTGDWAEDKKAGYGITSLSVGRYEGQFKDDKMHGKGSFSFTNGDRYIGDWFNGKQEGQGIFTWANDDRFEGRFKAGKLHEHGSYYFANGNQFTGEWNDGERVADHGSITWADVARHSTVYSEICRHHINDNFSSKCRLADIMEEHL